MKRIAIAVLVTLILAGAGLAYMGYNAIYKDNINTKDATTIYIPDGADFDQLLDTLSQNNILINESSFGWVAKLMKFENVKPGKYIIQPEWNNRECIQYLRLGLQQPVNVTFNNVRTVDELAGIFAEYLQPDSLSFLNAIMDSALHESLGMNAQTILSLFIPNTYEMYWNTNPDKLIRRMVEEHKRFWNEERSALQEASGFSKTEIYTIASIVQKETNLAHEKPIMAGVYINRLKQGIPLQADPTVVFAVGDFTIRRVLNKHIAFDSPYNTYKYNGLPPGPIFMPDVNTIDAVLNYENHKYLYFCASPDKIGAHDFARTLTEHNRNANRYRKWLNQQRIFK
ncbi:MAG: endolytic transglycosylase MltG [Saprospiraceae bacterium]|nr:endolytic transglycosylase MltG [Saprospiraceae bacterium]